MGRKSRFYRFLEMIPGLLTWGTFAAAVFFSYSHPVWIAYFIILFDLYWLLKALNIELHLIHTHQKIVIHQNYDWRARCKKLIAIPNLMHELMTQQATTPNKAERRDLQEEIGRLQRQMERKKTASLDWRQIWHLILLPTVYEPLDVLTASIESYKNSFYPTNRMIFVLACEARSGSYAKIAAQTIREKYESVFFRFLVTFHPDNLEGEARTKGANLTYAARQAKQVIDEHSIPFENVIVSAFDADTIVRPEYFAQLTYTYLTSQSPTRSSFQPIPLYHNNVWDAPVINRLVAVTSSFWQMIEASRPDRLVTFSSHSMSFKALVEVNFWPVNVISEDSQIFWRCFLHYHGDYRTVPLFTTVSLDAVVLNTYWGSLVGQYKQNRRWAWGVADLPYVLHGFLKDHKIALWKKVIYGYRLLEGHYFWATAALMIALLGWLPLLLGGNRFDLPVLALNLPKVTGLIMTVSSVFLIFSVFIYFILLPQRPAHRSRFQSWSMFLQWLFVPISSIFFGALPAVDAQTKLFLGRYMEFWVTPKVRKMEQGRLTSHNYNLKA